MDAFKLRIAHNSQTRDTLTVINFLPELKSYLHEIVEHGKTALNEETYSHLTSILTFLIFFTMKAEAAASAGMRVMWYNGTPSRSRQDLLREHGGIEILIRMLRTPFQATDLSLQDMFEAAGAANISYSAEATQFEEGFGVQSEDHAHSQMARDDRERLRLLFGINQLVYRLLTVLTQDHSPNQMVCSDYLSTFIGQLGFGLNSAGFLSMLVKDNPQVLDIVSMQTVEQVCELILSQVTLTDI